MIYWLLLLGLLASACATTRPCPPVQARPDVRFYAAVGMDREGQRVRGWLVGNDDLAKLVLWGDELEKALVACAGGTP